MDGHIRSANIGFLVCYIAEQLQLLTIAKSFVLRRDASLLKDYLPPKRLYSLYSQCLIVPSQSRSVIDEYVVFITPTSLQLEIFHKILSPDRVDDLIEQSSTAESLALIGILTKISNSPILLKATAESVKEKERSMFHKRNFTEAANLVPKDAQIDDMNLSGMFIYFSVCFQTSSIVQGS